MPANLDELGLTYNPFEPAASGPPVRSGLELPESWETLLNSKLDHLRRTRGPKAIAISGEYGMGKTCVLRWLEEVALPQRGYKPYYFDNPQVRFYDLANGLLRRVGRYDFSKKLFELVEPRVEMAQRGLFGSNFEQFLRVCQKSAADRKKCVEHLQQAIRAAGVVDDEEVAYRFATVVVDLPVKPYFELRDFMEGRRGTLVAEGQEPVYFATILKVLRLADDTKAVAFLIDEFEEVALQRRLTRRQAHDYLATLKRLIDLAQEEDLLVAVSLTPEAVKTTEEIEPAMWDRFTAQGEHLLELGQRELEVARDDAKRLVERRLARAQGDAGAPSGSLHPFPDDLIELLTPATRSSPRRLVKVCHYAIADWNGETVPFTADYIAQAERRTYPPVEASEA